MNIINELEISAHEKTKEININEIDEILKTILLGEEKNKTLSKDKYEFLINNLKDEELIPILKYMNRVDFNFLEIIINGYTEYNFEDKNTENLILENITKCININFNKQIFYLVYEKLSKLFLKHKTLNDIESTKQFFKLFNVWKILYNSKNHTKNYIKASILFYPNLKENKGIKINFNNIDINIYNLQITFSFVRSRILNINKFIDNFSFLKVKDKEFKYEDIFIKNKNNDYSNFSKIERIQFYFKEKNYDILLNNESVSTGILSFNINSISEIFLLNNFIGEIESIEIDNFNEKNDIDFMIKFMKESIMPIFKASKIFKDGIIEIENNFFQDNKEIFNKEFIKYNNKSLGEEEKEMKYLNQIEYFGGLNSFIPLFKIIKYKISDLQILFENKEIGQKENIEYKNKLVIMIIDILKLIVKLICLSEHNFNNFRNIIIPLIGSISEIIHVLNNPSNFEAKSLLLKDEIIFILYMIIIFCHSPSNLIKVYENIFEIKNNINNYNFSLDSIIFDLKEIKVDLYWYFLMVFNIIISFLIFFDSKDKIPVKILSQFNSIKELLSDNKYQNGNDNFYEVLSLNNFTSIINYYFLDLTKKFLIDDDELNQNEIYIKYVNYMTNTILNTKLFPKITNLISFKENSLIIDLEKDLIEIISGLNNSKKSFDLIINNFRYYKNGYSFFKKISSSISKSNFIYNNMLLMNQLIDYHGQYHHLIKELFIFNRLWSNQKLFYNDHFDTQSKSNLKYKNINYYTRNFQRPIIYPVLDYKYRYPIFSKFRIKENNSFYTNKEMEDDYNFNLEIPEIDNLTKKLNKEVIDEIEISEKYIYNVCLIKQEYHVKGKIYVFNKENNLYIFFFCNQFEENELCCNKTKDPKGFVNDNLCYGSLFKCPEKEKNRKIKIPFYNIKMIIKRIYYYRKSGIEIFTNRKSYYFNFYEEKDLDNFLSLFKGLFEESFFPIKVKDNFIGYIKGNKKLVNSKYNFIDFISQKIYKNQISEMCAFDIIILINLISNRSYNDLSQYPVFPILFFYDNRNKTIVERDFKEHIGLQSVMDSSIKRKEFILNKIEEFDEDEEEQQLEYFTTNYSTGTYTCNFMIRLFPYSFCCIEFQGDGFDDPNRLFFSLESALYNIGSQKSDLRELIPEFYYLPEMFLNINCINFLARANKEKVDDVIMIKNLQNNKSKSNENNIFIFVDYMKYKLEHLNDNLMNWVNLIFGKYQKFPKKNKNSKIKYFRDISYIDLDDKKSKKYSNDDSIMKSVEFGIIPLQTIFDNKIINNFNLKNSNYEKLEEISKKELKKENNINKNNNIKILENKYLNNKDYWEEDLNIKIKIDNIYGKISIFSNKTLACEIFDHSDEILDSFYNSRLNMFATTAKDGFICVYIIPNKLICVIKHPNNSYFNKVYLSANPFPSIIAYERNNDNIFRSYSLSGLLIKEEILGIKDDIIINCFFDFFGGAFNDGIMIYNKNNEFIKSYYIPFFNDAIK